MCLIRGYNLALSWVLTQSDIAEIKQEFANFVVGYQQLYGPDLDDNPDRYIQ